MNGSGIDLMDTVRRQLDEVVAVLAAAEDSDLSKRCSGAEADATGTVAAAAMHLAEGYGRLGRFLHSTGYVAEAPPAGPEHGDSHGHGNGPRPATIADVLQVLHGMEQPVTLLGELTDEQLNSVPATTNRFTNEHRTLRGVIEEMTAHQAAHLAAIKRALA